MALGGSAGSAQRQHGVTAPEGRAGQGTGRKRATPARADAHAQRAAAGLAQATPAHRAAARLARSRADADRRALDF
jgi:hypothetical protein